jgi:hypothetical protein
VLTRLTLDNIEDWDFRSYVEPRTRGETTRTLREPGPNQFLYANYEFVQHVDSLRYAHLRFFLEHEMARYSDDGHDVVLEPLGETMLRFRGSWRDVLTKDGRLERKIVKSLQREWKKYGRFRLRLIPFEIQATRSIHASLDEIEQPGPRMRDVTVPLSIDHAQQTADALRALATALEDTSDVRDLLRIAKMLEGIAHGVSAAIPTMDTLEITMPLRDALEVVGALRYVVQTGAGEYAASGDLLRISELFSDAADAAA